MTVENPLQSTCVTMNWSDDMKLDALLIGKSDCIADALRKSGRINKLYVISDFANPGIDRKADTLIIEHTNDAEAVAKHAALLKPDFAIVGSEEPLANGVVDALNALGIPCVGPTRSLARLESSKAFTRELIAKYNIPGNPDFRVFRDEGGLEEHLQSLGDFVVKPDGLTGGKGVKVYGEHFTSIAEAMEYCRELLQSGSRTLIIEERLDGEEFSFHSFFDGEHIAHMIPVQDHKRALDDDTGLNTGGMGSYSCADHLLPFLSADHIAQAEEINLQVGRALKLETGEPYKGILYGGFMLTKSGIRVIEYNARFGDPEVMNILSLLETDFVDICASIIEGTLAPEQVSFRRQASVCKYIVPAGYPKKSAEVVGSRISLHTAEHAGSEGLRLYYGAVNMVGNELELTDSRSLAYVGIADTLAQAEKIAERAASSVQGPVFHRRDIGTARLIQKRIDHMDRIWGNSVERQIG